MGKSLGQPLWAVRGRMGGIGKLVENGMGGDMGSTLRKKRHRGKRRTRALEKDCVERNMPHSQKYKSSNPQ